MVKDRVKYYEVNDLFYGHNLNKIETIVIPDISEIDINDAIEFYEIKRYFDKGIRSKTWSDEEVQAYVEKSQKLYGLTLRFFNTIDNTTIVQKYSEVEHSYHEEFWVLFNNCKLFDKITDDTFEKLVHSDGIAPFDLFRHKKIVNRYGDILRGYIIVIDTSIKILMHVYEQDYKQVEKLFLPTVLTSTDKCSCIEKYVDNEFANTNMLNKIVQMRYTSLFPISDELRLKAKRRYTIEIEKISNTGISLEYGIHLSFTPDQDEEKTVENDGNEFNFTYSTHWLLDTLDYPSILNNFIYIFEYVDVPQMRSLHISKKSQLGVFERIMYSGSSRIYNHGSSFNMINAVANMQVYSYYNFLKSQNICLEDVLKWFFTEYLQLEHNCSEIRVAFPSEGSTYAEKCSTIITALETILKQFYFYVKNREIDFELVGMSTTPISLESLPSLVSNKYVYGIGQDYENLTFMLFSDQCLYSHVPRIHEQNNEDESCFLDLILKEQVNLSDYKDNEHSSFRYMADYDLIEITPDGFISVKNKDKVAVLKELYKNEVISKWHCSVAIISGIRELVDRGILIEKSSLISSPETNYLNYLLNRSEYDNGLEIRNEYIHGIQQVNMDENEHIQNYMILLKIFVLLAIKVNDDFELRSMMEKRENGDRP